MDALYRSLRWIARLALSFYYQEVEIQGGEHVPSGGPLLVLANHQISLVDPLLLAHAVPRPLRFLAKAPLFRIPVLGSLMRLTGSIPVQRKQDKGYAKEGNAGLYEAVSQALIEGSAIGIFPEGISHDNPMLGEFRHGASRIALEAESSKDFQLGLRILLVGIHIEDSRLFRGRVLLNIAPPISVADLAADHREDPRATVEKLTERLKDDLRKQVLEAEDHEDLHLAGLIETLHLFPDPQPGLGGAFARKKFILEQYRKLGASHPTQVQLIRELLILYGDALEYQPPVEDEEGPRKRRWLRSLFDLSWRIFVSTPFILLGVAANGIPFLFLRMSAIFLTRVQGRGQDVRASLGILLGIPVFLGWYAALAWMAVKSNHPLVLVPLLFFCPLAGLAAVSGLTAWKRALRRLLVTVTSFSTRGAHESRERLKKLLSDQIMRLYVDTGAPRPP